LCKNYLVFLYSERFILAETEGAVSSNLIVICRGRYFMFDVLDSSGYIITAPEIEQQLRHIYITCAGKPEGSGIGALTAEYRTTWWKVSFSVIDIISVQYFAHSHQCTNFWPFTWWSPTDSCHCLENVVKFTIRISRAPKSPGYVRDFWKVPKKMWKLWTPERCNYWSYLFI